jgi:tetratricopeptide (TPR) repeat protein
VRLLAAGAFAACLCAPVFAQTPEVAAARGHFQAGRVYFEKGEYRRALVEFHEAQRDADRPELDFNLGRTFDALGDAARAVRCYRRYLDRRPIADDRATVEQRISALDEHIGMVRIESQVVGATLRLDGEPLEGGGSGQPIAVTEGRHRISAARDGYKARVAEVVVTAGRETDLAIDPVRPASRWWIGLTIGALLAVAGAVTAALVVTARRDPTPGDFIPMTIATVP